MFAVLSAAVITFSGSLAVHQLLMNKYTVHTEESQAFPFQHWIMMGLQGNGTFNYIDEDFTKAFPFKYVRIEENNRIIKERLSDLGAGGLLKLWGRKMNVTWSDGYDDYASNLLLTRTNNAMTDFLSGWRAEFIAAYLHIYNCMSWLLLLICAMQLFKKGFADIGYTICITLLGGIIFHLLWEAGEPYSMPFALLMIAGAALGTDAFFRPSFQGFLQKHGLRRLLFLIPASALIWCICLLPKLWQTAFDVSETAALQNLIGGEYLCLEEGDTVTQTVQAARPFNHLILRYKYYGEPDNDIHALLRLYDSEGNCLTEQMMPLKSAVTVTEFTLPDIFPDGTETYTIELHGEKIPAGSKLGITAYNTDNWDTYPKGEAAVNGSAVENADIFFEFTNRCSRTLL